MHGHGQAKETSQTYFDLLDRNKEAFVYATTEEMVEPATRRRQDSTRQLLRILKTVFRQTEQLTDEQELYAKMVVARLEAGGLPKQTVKTALNQVKKISVATISPLKVLAVLQTTVPARFSRATMRNRIPALPASAKSYYLCIWRSSWFIIGKNE